MSAEDLLQRVAVLAREAAEVADTIRPIEAIPGECWVGANGIADDLEALERDLRSDLVAATAKTTCQCGNIEMVAFAGYKAEGLRCWLCPPKDDEPTLRLVR